MPPLVIRDDPSDDDSSVGSGDSGAATPAARYEGVSLAAIQAALEDAETTAGGVIAVEERAEGRLFLAMEKREGAFSTTSTSTSQDKNADPERRCREETREYHIIPKFTVASQVLLALVLLALVLLPTALVIVRSYCLIVV